MPLLAAERADAGAASHLGRRDAGQFLVPHAHPEPSSLRALGQPPGRPAAGPLGSSPCCARPCSAWTSRRFAALRRLLLEGYEVHTGEAYKLFMPMMILWGGRDHLLGGSIPSRLRHDFPEAEYHILLLRRAAYERRCWCAIFCAAGSAKCGSSRKITFNRRRIAIQACFPPITACCPFAAARGTIASANAKGART